LNLKLICRDCKDPVPNIVEDFAQGDLICGNCGLVLGNRIIDTRSEWRTFANDDGGSDPSRIGAVSDPLMGGTTMESTVIGGKDGGTGTANEYNRIHGKVTNQRSEKALVSAFKEIQVMSERIGLSKIVVDSAKQLYKKVDEEKLLKGKAQDAIMAACIYIGCREQNLTRTFKEICALTKVSKKEIGRCYKALQPLFENPVQKISIDAYISRFASNLGLDNDVQKASLQLANKVMDLGVLAGKSPISLVSACLFYISSMSKVPVSAKDIAETAGCTEGTLKNAYRILYTNRKDLPVDEKIFKIENLPEN